MMISLKKDLWEIRWHGRGGQGSVTASNLLASAALKDGLFFRSLPEFGAERSGAPVVVYTRVGKYRIYDQGPVTEPDLVVVLASTSIGRVDFLDGLKREGVLLVNSILSPQELRESLGLDSIQVATVDATGIAMRFLKRGIPSGAMLGAVVRVADVVSRESQASALEEDLTARFRREVVEANLHCFDQGYRDTSVD